MKCHDEFPYEVHIFYFYEILCFYILIRACIARHKMGSCKWLLADRAVDGATAGVLGGWPRKKGRGRMGGKGEGGALAIQWVATMSDFLCLESILMLRCAISTLLNFYLGTRCFDVVLKIQARMKNVRLRIDKLLPKIGSSPYLVKKGRVTHTQLPFTIRRPGERTLFPSNFSDYKSHPHVIHKSPQVTENFQQFILMEEKRKEKSSMRTCEAVGRPEGPHYPFPIRLSGSIIKGFGRGSKEVSE